MSRRKKKKRELRVASTRAVNTPNTTAEAEPARPRPQRFVLHAGWMSAAALSITLAYWQLAEPDLASEGPPVIGTARADPGPDFARLLETFKVHVRNRGWRSGHVERVEIRPLKFDQRVEVEVRYTDRRSIGPLQEKLLTFQFVQIVRHDGDHTFLVTLIDNTGKQMEEMQFGAQVWKDGEPAPPRRNKPKIPD